MPSPFALWHSWIKSLSCKTKATHVHDPLSSSSSPSSSSSSSSCSNPSPQSTSSSSSSGAGGGTSSGTCQSFSTASPYVPKENGNSRRHRHNEIKTSMSMSGRKLSFDHNSFTSSRLVHSRNVSCEQQQQLSLRECSSFRSNSMPPQLHRHRHRSTASFRRTLGSMSCYDCTLDVQMPVPIASSSSSSSCVLEHPICQRCGDLFPTYDALDHHHLSMHALTELRAGNPSRNVVEIIFKTSWAKEKQARQFKIDRVLKVNNPGRRIWRFEEYRDSVKGEASRLPLEKKQPRCHADGNELLRFYAASIACPLLPSLCLSPSCHVCTIVQSGFSTSEQDLRWRSHGIRTSATSSHAHDQAGLAMGTPIRAMLLCRVIAGRVYKTTTMDEEEELRSKTKSKSNYSPPLGFDSIAGPPGPYSNIEDLCVSHPNSILPCFIVVYSS